MAQANGSHIRMYELMVFLTKHFESVTVYSYQNHIDEPWTEQHQALFKHAFPKARLVLENQTFPMRLATKSKNIAIALFPWFTKAILRLSIPGVTPNFRKLLDENPASPLFLNYVDGAVQLNGVPPERVAIETHDIGFAKIVKQRRYDPTSFRALAKLRTEISILDSADAVVAITRIDAQFFRIVLPNANVFYIPSYEIQLVPPTKAKSDFLYDLLFVASENVLNERGAIEFVEENALWLSHYRIALCGRICDLPSIRGLASKHPNITLLGFVGELREVYAQSKACISPVDGTGLKIKVVEALRHGKPVLASQHSIDGLTAGHEDCVFPLTEHNAKNLLADETRLSHAQNAALSYALKFQSAGDLDDFTAYFFGTGTGSKTSAVSDA